MFIGRNAEWSDGDPGYVLRHNGSRSALEAAALSESLQESSREAQAAGLLDNVPDAGDCEQRG